MLRSTASPLSLYFIVRVLVLQFQTLFPSKLMLFILGTFLKAVKAVVLKRKSIMPVTNSSYKLDSGRRASHRRLPPPRDRHPTEAKRTGTSKPSVPDNTFLLIPKPRVHLACRYMVYIIFWYHFKIISSPKSRINGFWCVRSNLILRYFCLKVTGNATNSIQLKLRSSRLLTTQR